MGRYPSNIFHIVCLNSGGTPRQQADLSDAMSSSGSANKPWNFLGLRVRPEEAGFVDIGGELDNARRVGECCLGDEEEVEDEADVPVDAEALADDMELVDGEVGVKCVPGVLEGGVREGKAVCCATVAGAAVGVVPLIVPGANTVVFVPPPKWEVGPESGIKGGGCSALGRGGVMLRESFAVETGGFLGVVVLVL